MDAAKIIDILLAVIGALLMGLWGNLTYEMRKLRRVVHKNAGSIHALNLIVYILCKKNGLDWDYKSGPED